MSFTHNEWVYSMSPMERYSGVRWFSCLFLFLLLMIKIKSTTWQKCKRSIRSIWRCLFRSRFKTKQMKIGLVDIDGSILVIYIYIYIVIGQCRGVDEKGRRSTRLIPKPHKAVDRQLCLVQEVYRSLLRAKHRKEIEIHTMQTSGHPKGNLYPLSPLIYSEKECTIIYFANKRRKKNSIVSFFDRKKFVKINRNFKVKI